MSSCYSKIKVIVVFLDVQRFITSYSTTYLQYTPTTTSQNFSITLADSGNQVALEDALNFSLVLSVTFSSFSGYTVIVLSSANVTINDLDGK